MKIWALLSFTACGIGLFLSGCGGGSAPVAPPVSPLAGNWLIVGPMPIPTDEFEFRYGFRFALTVDVLDNHVFAAGFGNSSCGNFAGSFALPSAATGTIATDGTFSLLTPAESSITLSLQGTVPKGNNVPWPGNYTISFSPQIGASGQGCDSPLTGEFTAISFPLFNGIYAGTGTPVNFNTVSGTTSISAQMLLHQGMMTTDSTSGKQVFDNVRLTGNIRVQGSACFSSGVMDSLSGVQGNEVWAQSTMDDGSTVTVAGTLTDPSETSITPYLLMLQGGKCGSTPVYYVLSELERQS
jgi:hypothetical protein